VYECFLNKERENRFQLGFDLNLIDEEKRIKKRKTGKT